MQQCRPPQLNFLGLEAQAMEVERPLVSVLPVPCEMTVTYGQGAGKGPRAILEASDNIELYDEELLYEPWRLGIRTYDFLALPVADPAAMISRVEAAVREIITGGSIPIMLGGEHTITVGGVAGAMSAGKDISVVSFDAHADFRDSYQDHALSHACTLRRVTEKVKVTNIGVRSLSVGEANEIKEQSRYSMIRAVEVADTDSIVERIIARSSDSLYLSIDLDALDPSIMPAVGTPEPGGLQWSQLLAIIRGLCERRTVVAADVVELAPIPGYAAPNFVAAKLVYKIMGYLGNIGRTASANFRSI